MDFFHGIERALVVAAHPDDEVLGCGATVARLAASGAEVRTLFLATGAMSRSDATAAEVENLKRSAREAAKILGVAEIRFGEFPDNRMDTVPLLDVVRKIEKSARDFLPQLVLTHHCGDLNVDHRICHQAVLTACRPVPGSSVAAIIAFETPSSTEFSGSAWPAFQPNLYIEVSEYFDAKLKALREYESELRPDPHARSMEQVKDKASLRGREAGIGAAEAFEIVRAIAER